MRNYQKAATKALPVFTTVVAACGIEKSLRPFLRRKFNSFVAVLIVPDDVNLREYTLAAESLMAATEIPKSFRESDHAVESFDDPKDIAKSRMIEDARFSPRTVILLTGQIEVPAELRVAADIVAKIEPPTAEHFLEAARRKKVNWLTKEDAELLSTLPWKLIRTSFQKGRSAQTAMRRLRAFQAQARGGDAHAETGIDREGRVPSLHHLEGFGEAKDWALELARDLEDYKQGRISWEDIDSGLLVSGPPGSGKTTFAMALGTTCGIPVVVASSAQWQARGHLGDMLKAMRASFAEARTLAPCILLIDEFDAFSQRVNTGEEYNDKYQRQVINGLLECLDGAERRVGVIVVGATNFPNGIDEALLRPGRLDRHIVIPLPDAKARCAILEYHLKKKLAVLGDFARDSVGMSAALIERIARDARRSARRARQDVGIEHVRAAMPAREELSDEFKKYVAVHEVGHAIIGVLLQCGSLNMLSIESTVVIGGGNQPYGFASFIKPARGPRRPQTFLDHIAMLLGGIAAEEVVFGSFGEGAGGVEGADLNVATDLATAMEAQLGMGFTLISEEGNGRLHSLRETDPALRRRVDALLQSQFARAKAIIRENLPLLEMLIELLVQRGALLGSEVVLLIEASQRGSQSASAVG